MSHLPSEELGLPNSSGSDSTAASQKATVPPIMQQLSLRDCSLGPLPLTTQIKYTCKHRARASLAEVSQCDCNSVYRVYMDVMAIKSSN